jgi:hypothetical protein
MKEFPALSLQAVYPSELCFPGRHTIPIAAKIVALATNHPGGHFGRAR